MSSSSTLDQLKSLVTQLFTSQPSTSSEGGTDKPSESFSQATEDLTDFLSSIRDGNLGGALPQ